MSAPREGRVRWAAERIIHLGELRLRALEAGSGPPVLVLASPLVRARTYRPLVQRLSAGFRVLVLELPGSGRSSRTPRPWGPPALAEAARSFLEAVGIPRAVVVGHSNSGPVAVELALLAPERVGRLVLCDTIGANPGDRLGRVVRGRALDALQEPALTVRGAPHVLTNAVVHRRAFLHQVSLAARLDVLGRAARLALPTLVAWGRRDRTMPPSCAARLLEVIPGAQVAFGTGGHDWLITHAREFAGALAGFARGPEAASIPPPLAAGDAGALRRWVGALSRTLGERNALDAERHRRLGLAEAAIGGAFRALGLSPRRDAYLAGGRPVANVEVEIPGSSAADEVVVVGAHYDTAAGSPGAADDATGVAALLALAAHLARLPARTARTVRLVAFATEEPPFTRTAEMGSRVHARRARARGDRIVAMLSLETLGAGTRVAVIGNLRSRALARAVARDLGETVRTHRVVLPGFLPGVKSSDHWSFWKEGYRAAMITDGAPLRHPLAYHQRRDVPGRVDHGALARLTASLAQVVESLAGAPLRVQIAGALH